MPEADSTNTSPRQINPVESDDDVRDRLPAGTDALPIDHQAAGAAVIHSSDEYRCRTCGYSLRGLAATGSCPECKTLYEPLPPVIPAGYVCYRCSYSLGGMPTDGACPECGTQYSFAHAFRGLPYPGQMSLVLRVGWPALIAAPLVGFFALSTLGSRVSGAESIVCLVALLYVANLLNFPISTSSIIKNYVPPSKRRGYFAALLSLGGWVLASWIVSLAFLAIPLLAIGLFVFSQILFR